MIQMTIKLNRKRLNACEHKGYEGYKKLFSFIIRSHGFTDKGRGTFTKDEYQYSEMFHTIIPIVMEFEQTYDDMIDDIYQWTYHDSKHESFDVLTWYNTYRRKYFEEEVLPEIQAFRQIRANQMKARLMLRMKQNKKPITETPEPTPATNYKEFPFDDEVPF